MAEKIVLNRKEIFAASKSALQATNSKFTDFMISPCDAGLTIAGSKDTLYIGRTIEGRFEFEAFKVCASDFHKGLSSLESDTVEIASEKHKIGVYSGNSLFRLPINEEVESFPDYAYLSTPEEEMDITGTDIRRALLVKDCVDLVAGLPTSKCGIYLIEEHAVGFNGRFLMRSKLSTEFPAGRRDIGLYPEGLKVVSDLSADAEIVRVRLHSGRVEFVGDGFRVVTGRIPCGMPIFEKSIRAESPTTWIANTEELASAVRSANLYGPVSVGLEVVNNQLRVFTGHSERLGSSESFVQVEASGGISHVFMNPENISSALSAIQSEKCEIGLLSQTQPVFIKPFEGDEIFAASAPMPVHANLLKVTA